MSASHPKRTTGVGACISQGQSRKSDKSGRRDPNWARIGVFKLKVNHLMAEANVWSRAYLAEQFKTALLNPIRAFRPRYLPLMMVYFAYGALGLITVAESFWIKKALTLSPSELAALSVWLSLPGTV